MLKQEGMGKSIMEKIRKSIVISFFFSANYLRGVKSIFQILYIHRLV